MDSFLEVLATVLLAILLPFVITPLLLRFINALNVVLVFEILHSAVQTPHDSPPVMHLPTALILLRDFTNRLLDLVNEASAKRSLNGVGQRQFVVIQCIGIVLHMLELYT